MEQTITIGLAQAIGIVVGIVVGIVGGGATVTFALLVYFDKKNEKRIDEVKGDMREMRGDMREMRGDIRETQRDHQTLTSKVDRIQGTLDVLAFGERLPEPVARERAETTGD